MHWLISLTRFQIVRRHIRGKMVQLHALAHQLNEIPEFATSLSRALSETTALARAHPARMQRLLRQAQQTTTARQRHSGKMAQLHALAHQLNEIPEFATSLSRALSETTALARAHPARMQRLLRQAQQTTTARQHSGQMVQLHALAHQLNEIPECATSLSRALSETTAFARAHPARMQRLLRQAQQTNTARQRLSGKMVQLSEIPEFATSLSRALSETTAFARAHPARMQRLLRQAQQTTTARQHSGQDGSTSCAGSSA